MATSATAALGRRVRHRRQRHRIKIGNIVPYSGPASAMAVIGKTMGAVFKRANDKAHQRPQDQFISYDDAYCRRRRRAGAQADQSDEVLLLFGRSAPLPTRDPEILQQEGAASVRRQRPTKWNDPSTFLDHGLAAELPERVRILREVSHEEKPETKIAVLYQNDDMAGLLKGLKDGFPRIPPASCGGKLRGVGADHRLAFCGRIKSSIRMSCVLHTKFGAQAVKKLGDS